jgi:aminoglycoside 6'-N-acetyltransferase
VLRPLELEDVDQVETIQAQPSIARWWGAPERPELEAKARGEDEATAFAIQEAGKTVGLIQYYEENDADFRHAGIDLFLSDRAQGRGLGPDAIRTLARHLIEDRGHHRLVIDPALDNVEAVRAYEKVGFRRVGVMRKYWRDPNGDWRDGLLLDLLAEELR